jgi:hypothetical protein
MAKITMMSPFTLPGTLARNARRSRVNAGRKARTQIRAITGIIIDVAAMGISTGLGSTAIS